MKIKLEQDYYDLGVKLFPYKTLNLEPGITILVGCNGSGKTTLLKQIKCHCSDNNVKYLYYDNYKEGGVHAMQSNLLFNDIKAVALDAVSSEGERIFHNINRYSSKIKETIDDLKNGDEFVLLLDAIDSGLDAATTDLVKENLLHQIVSYCDQKGIIVYIIITSNSFEMGRNERCISLVDGKYHNLKTYDSYRKVIEKTFQLKMERYNKESA